MRSALRSLWRIMMSWDRKGDRRLKYIKRNKSKSNSKSKRFKKLKKEELKYKDELNDIRSHLENWDN